MNTANSAVPAVPSFRNSTTKDYIGLAERRWRYAAWICGSGRYALLAACRELTACLYETREEAEAAKARIDETGCGGNCWHGSGHKIIDLEKSSRRKCLEADPFLPLRG